MENHTFFDWLRVIKTTGIKTGADTLVFADLSKIATDPDKFECTECGDNRLKSRCLFNKSLCNYCDSKKQLLDFSNKI